ncbi:MAG: DinB family protein [Fimbriimonadales bacterium]
MALVRADLYEVLGRLKDEDLPWAPSRGMRTIAGQLAEIAGTERQLMAWLLDQKQISFEVANEFGDRGLSLAGMKEALDEVRASTLVFMDSLAEEDLETPVPMPEGWFESLGQPEIQPSEVFRSLAQHEWYHVGQLVSYLWSRGDDPYKW